jgi:U3 small nucleolar RNA-associated protein 12
MEELFDEMDLDQHFEEKQENDAEKVLQTTVESMKAGELIQESLSVYEMEQKDWEKYLQIGGIKPPRNAFVIQKSMENLEPCRVVYQIIKGIRTTHLNDALLTLPFSQILILFQVMQQWVIKNYEPSLLCKVLFFILNVHHNEIVSSGNKAILQDINSGLRMTLKKQKDLVGQNLAGLRLLSLQEREVNFFGEVEEESRGIKRVIVS